MQNCKDGSGLKLINFDFVTEADKKSKFPFLWNFEFFSCYFVFLVHISLLSSLLGDFFLPISR